MTANQTVIQDYLHYLQIQRQYSAHTISNYQRDLLQLIALTTDQEPLAQLSHFDIRRYTSKLHAQGLSPATIARKLSAWRGFFSWLAQHQTMQSNPVTGVKAPKRGKALPKALSVDDAMHLVKHTLSTSEVNSPDVICNAAMFELLYSSGLRVSELTSLDIAYIKNTEHLSIAWIDLTAAEVTVTGKGNKRRSVPMGAAAVTALRHWLEVRSALIEQLTQADTAALFLTGRGKRMTPRIVQERLKKHASAIGIPSKVHPHVLRHSFASHVLQSSGDLRAVQEMLGHASIASTQVYTSLDFQRLAQVYDAAHPRAKKQNSPN